MNLAKSYDFFKPSDVDGRVHIIGCGAVGSVLAENLARFGVTEMTLWDFDTVEEKNVANQLYVAADKNRLKVEALADHLRAINPEIDSGLKLRLKGWDGERLSGWVFLCVDSIELRRRIVEFLDGNEFVKGVFDFRMGLTDGQHYAADWSKAAQRESLLNSMQFSHADAEANTPMSACHEPLSVCFSIRALVAMGVANFTKFIRTGELKKVILLDAENFMMDAF